MATLTRTPMPFLDVDTALSPSPSNTRIDHSHVLGDTQQQQQQQCEPIDLSGDSSRSDASSDLAATVATTAKQITALSPRRPEDNNQHEDDSGGRKDQEPSVAGGHEQPAATASRASPLVHGQSQQQPRHEPHPEQQTRASPEKVEIARLRSENLALMSKLRDLSAQYGRHVHELQTTQQQQAAAHERAAKDAQRQVNALQRAHTEAIDDARRARAQVQVLEDRLAQIVAHVPSVELDTTSGQQQQQQQQLAAASTPQPLRLTQQQSFFTSSSRQHSHTVHPSVVGAAHANAAHVTCHSPSARPEAQTVRATRLGRQRSTAASDSSPSAQPAAIGVTSMLPPPANTFRWSEGSRASYSSYTTPTPSPPAPACVRSSAYYSTQSYAQQQQQQPPIGYQQPHQQPSVVAPAPAPDSPPAFSICFVPDDAAESVASREPVKPSSGLLAYCSELLTSSRLSPAASAPTPSSSVSNSASATARVAPTAWTFFGGSSAPPAAQQTGLDVEQGYASLHHAHRIPQPQSVYADMSSAVPAAATALRQPNHHGSSMTSSPVRRTGGSSVLPTHDPFSSSV